MTEDDLKFLEELAEIEFETPPEPHSYTHPKRRTSPEVDMDQEELVAARLQTLTATQEEREACENAALAVIEYRQTGEVVTSAMEIIEEVCSDPRRQVKLLNVVIPLARVLGA